MAFLKGVRFASDGKGGREIMEVRAVRYQKLFFFFYNCEIRMPDGPPGVGRE